MHPVTSNTYFPSQKFHRASGPIFFFFSKTSFQDRIEMFPPQGPTDSWIVASEFRFAAQI